MNKLAIFGLSVGLTGMVSYAADWEGKLIDAVCYDTTQAKSTGDKLNKECAPTASTSAYAIHTDNKVYKFDPSGNDKASALMQAKAIKRDKEGDVHIKVEGSLQGNTVNVRSIKGDD